MSLLQETIAMIEPQDQTARATARERLEQLTMPHWALGRLMDTAEDLAGMTRSQRPPIARRAVVVMAGDHGVAAEGVSKFPSEVTPQMVLNFVNGGAGINALARSTNTDVIVADLGVAVDLQAMAPPNTVRDLKVAMGTENLAVGPAMRREQAVDALENGIRLANELAESYDVLGLGEMGIANTTPAAAVLCALTGCSTEVATGRGTGIDDEALANKKRVIERGLAVNRPDAGDGLDVLTKVGGFEIGGLAGLALGWAALRRPVVVDGFITTAAALLAQSLAPESTQYMIAATKSVEPGHILMLERLGLAPLLDLNLRLGEGTGGALAMGLLDAAVRVLSEVATFAEAAVSEADK